MRLRHFTRWWNCLEERSVPNDSEMFLSMFLHAKGVKGGGGDEGCEASLRFRDGRFIQGDALSGGGNVSGGCIRDVATREIDVGTAGKRKKEIKIGDR